MKTANWENSERSLELKLGDQLTNLYDQAWAIARPLHWAFPKRVDQNKIQACIQKSDEPVHNYYNQLQILKENSGLPSNVDSTWGVFYFMFIYGLNWDLPLLVQRTGVEWETMPTPDLVTLANQPSRTLEESHKRIVTKILNLQLQRMKAPQ